MLSIWGSANISRSELIGTGRNSGRSELLQPTRAEAWCEKCAQARRGAHRDDRGAGGWSPNLDLRPLRVCPGRTVFSEQRIIASRDDYGSIRTFECVEQRLRQDCP